MAVLCYTGQPFCHPRDTLRKHIDILTSSKGFKAILPRSFSLVNSFRPFLLKKFCRSWLPDSGRKIARHSTCNLQSLCARRGFFLFLHHNPTPYRTGHCRQCGTDRPALLPPPVDGAANIPLEAAPCPHAQNSVRWSGGNDPANILPLSVVPRILITRISLIFDVLSICLAEEFRA